ncbi:MAG TPA: nucleotide sugar dehydrogenase [Coxiellaceae bacterium]|nr:nucleotide sugar dehydrogenase [Coxiellaceae bacterium]
MNTLNQATVAVIGLGYVGLPLAVAFAAHQPVIGFDKKRDRIDELTQGIERTGEVDPALLKQGQITFTSDPADLKKARVYIVAVPTPVDEFNSPDMTLLYRASQTVGQVLSKGDYVVFESTVYPGATEEECVPILEAESQLKAGRDFFVGYSPERINPGDKHHNLASIVKVVSANTLEATRVLADFYRQVVKAGVYEASSIRVAEAAKVIENTQRDINIALMNELGIIFNRMRIDTAEVLKAAQTKWNFLPFKPGLVGGHCIGVDPYYLTYKAQQYGYQPEVILSGRRVNDGMGAYIAEQTVKQLIRHDKPVKHAHVAILGLTFKENCPDLRNSKVVDIIRSLEEYEIHCHVIDPRAEEKEAKEYYGLTLTSWENLSDIDAFIVAVAHTEFEPLSADDFIKKSRGKSLLMDVKSFFPKHTFEENGILVWRL